MRQRNFIAILYCATLVFVGASCSNSATISSIVWPEDAAEIDNLSSEECQAEPWEFGQAQTLQILFFSLYLAEQSGNGACIEGIAFRLDESATSDWPSSVSPYFESGFKNFEIKIENPQLILAGPLPTTFADNFSEEAVTIRGGILTFPKGAFKSGESPNSFGPPIMFNEPFCASGSGWYFIQIRASDATEGEDALVIDTCATDPLAYGSKMLYATGAGADSATTATVGPINTAPVFKLLITYQK